MPQTTKIQANLQHLLAPWNHAPWNHAPWERLPWERRVVLGPGY